MSAASNAPRVPQIAAELREAVLGGEYRPGHQLPSARVLADRYEVARGTINAAMTQLVREGLIISRPRAGWFVADETEVKDVLRSSAPKGSRHVRERVHSRPATQQDADQLGVKIGTQIFQITRAEVFPDGDFIDGEQQLVIAADHALVYEIPDEG